MSHNHDHGSGSDSTMDGCPMEMIFHIGYCESILFKAWTATTVGPFIGAVISVFFTSVLYEALKYYREKLFYDYRDRQLIEQRNRMVQKTFDGQSDSVETIISPKVLIRDHLTSRLHLIQTLMHFVQVIISYALMLIIMTYNVWLFLAVTLGATTGYFLFGWIRHKAIDITEHCH